MGNMARSAPQNDPTEDNLQVGHRNAHAAAYFPETNVLVALDVVARVSNTPVSKSIVARLEHRTEM
jgi:hypothetical protein